MVTVVKKNSYNLNRCNVRAQRNENLLVNVIGTLK